MSYAADTAFEGSYGGDAGRIAAGTRLECKICWYVYDPALGCATWQIAPGTPFAALPDHWRCPNCDAAKSGFMALAPDDAVAASPGEDPSPAAAPAPVVAEAGHRAAKALGALFEATFRDVHQGKMRDVPLLNPALSVQAVGFRPHPLGTIGILLTPWFMNVVLVPGEPIDEPVGARRIVAFGSGAYEFVVARRPETGAYLACSLFSPVHEFNTQLVAIEVALAALDAIDKPEHREEGARSAEIRAARLAELEPKQKVPPAAAELRPSRRAFLGGGAPGRDDPS